MLKKRFGIKSWFLTGIQCSVGVAVIVISVLAAVITSNGYTETAGEDLTAIVPLEKDVIASVSGERQEAASLISEEEEYLGEMEIAAYCSCEICIKKSDGYLTYSGDGGL